MARSHGRLPCRQPPPKFQGARKPDHRQAKANLLVAAAATYTRPDMRSLNQIEWLKAAGEAIDPLMHYSAASEILKRLSLEKKVFDPAPAACNAASYQQR